MNKICTTIEQSKKLIELGIDVNTSDMCYYFDHNWSNEHIEIPKVWDKNYEQFIPENEEDDIPAWSLSALLDLMPPIIDGLLPKLVKHKEGYFIEGDNNIFRDPLDAIFKLILQLKENGKI